MRIIRLGVHAAWQGPRGRDHYGATQRLRSRGKKWRHMVTWMCIYVWPARSRCPASACVRRSAGWLVSEWRRSYWNSHVELTELGGKRKTWNKHPL